MEHEIAALKQQVNGIAESQNEMKYALRDIAKSLKSLTVLEQQHSETQGALKRAFNRIDDQEGRLRDIEKDMPTMKLASGWIFKFALAVLGILGTVAVGVVAKGI
jgi:septal ring factor EnvC (AmiA/AmiB activator)